MDNNADNLAELAWKDQVPDEFRENNPVFFHITEPKEISPNVWFFMTFGNVSAVLTLEGWVLVDCAFIHMGEDIYDKIQLIKPVPIHTIIITHGHMDHCGGGSAMQACNLRDYQRPIRFVGHHNIQARFNRYIQTCEYNKCINHKQFGNEFDINYQELQSMNLTYDSEMVLIVGETTFNLYHDLGETDDATWIYLPKEKILIVGDFLIWNLCNCSNPQKAPRYPEQWAQTLRKMLKLESKFVLPGHGPYIAGKHRIDQMLDDTALTLEIIINQTIHLINQGYQKHEVVKRVQMPEYLLNKPYLRPFYADPEFIIQEIWKHKAGWWSGKMYELKELDMEKLGRSILGIFRDIPNFVTFVESQIKGGDLDLALFYVEVGKYAYPDNKDVLKLAETVYTHYSEFRNSPASMVRNQFRFNLSKIQEKLMSKL